MRLRSLKSFNPRPRRGGDRRHPQGGLRCSSFQSTPPQGGRPERSQRRRRKRQVSIHAPAGGATVLRWPKSPGWSCFNPRPRRGGDLHPDKLDEPFHWFQSTPPQGGRPKSQSITPDQCEFQSTPPQGGRLYRHTYWSADKCFNPRPRRGGDLPLLLRFLPLLLFQSTPPQGGRPSYSAKTMPVNRGFNPRPRRGGD